MDLGWTYLDPSQKAYVQEFLDDLLETHSMMARTSVSCVGSSVALTEIGLDQIFGE